MQKLDQGYIHCGVPINWRSTRLSTTDELLRNAQAYAASFDKGDLPLPPGRGALNEVDAPASGNGGIRGRLAGALGSRD